MTLRTKVIPRSVKSEVVGEMAGRFRLDVD